MTIYKNENELYHKYDIVVSEILTKIILISSDKEAIRLLGFDRRNKSHLLVLRLALMARDLYQLPVEVDCGWWDRFCLNWKMRKNFHKVKKVSNFIFEGVWVPHILELIKIENDFAFDFENIYKAYYERSLD